MALLEAVEGSTYILTVTFKDELGVTMVPKTAKWSLRNNRNAIVNSKSDVAIVAATSVSIVLSGADLAYEPNASTFRTFTVDGTYDSSTYGLNLPFAEEFTFTIRPLVGIADA